MDEPKLFEPLDSFESSPLSTQFFQGLKSPIILRNGSFPNTAEGLTANRETLEPCPETV